MVPDPGSMSRIVPDNRPKRAGTVSHAAPGRDGYPKRDGTPALPGGKRSGSAPLGPFLWTPKSIYGDTGAATRSTGNTSSIPT